MVRQLAMTALLATALVLPSVAQPQPGAGVQGRGWQPRPQRMAMIDRLNLTDQQQVQIEKLRVDFQKKLVPLQSKTRLLRLDLRGLYAADNLDRNAIEKKMKEISEVQLQANVARLDHQLAVKNILTADQQKVWKQHLLNVGANAPGGRMGLRQMRFDGRAGNYLQRPGRMMRWWDEADWEVEAGVQP